MAEIYSVHGSSEGCNTPFPMTCNGSMAPRLSGGSIQDGLARGYRLGIMASGDNGGGFAGKWGIGLVAARAAELTRKALWDAFLQRRVYGVTGDRIMMDFSVGEADMGSVVPRVDAVEVAARIRGVAALDRIEIIRNNRVVHTYCHSGAWEVPDHDGVRLKLAYEFGWGPSPRYGFETGAKRWSGRFRSPNATIVSVEGRFTRQGNRFEAISEHECVFELSTDPRQGAADDTAQQSLVFELAGDQRDGVVLECDGLEMRTTLQQSLGKTQLAVMSDDVLGRILEQFGLARGQIPNEPDVCYHNAYKIKRHLAAPECGYAAEVRWREEQPPPVDRSWYYLRVSQLNGQRAWSSPVWVDR